MLSRGLWTFSLCCPFRGLSVEWLVLGALCLDCCDLWLCKVFDIPTLPFHCIASSQLGFALPQLAIQFPGLKASY